MAGNSLVAQAIAIRQGIMDQLQSSQACKDRYVSGLTMFTVPLPKTPDDLERYTSALKLSVTQSQWRSDPWAPTTPIEGLSEIIDAGIETGKTNAQTPSSGLIEAHVWKLKKFADSGVHLNVKALDQKISEAKEGDKPKLTALKEAWQNFESVRSGIDNGSLEELVAMTKALQDLSAAADQVYRGIDGSFGTTTMESAMGHSWADLGTIARNQERTAMALAKQELGKTFKNLDELHDYIAKQEYTEDKEETQEHQESLDAAAQKAQAAAQTAGAGAITTTPNVTNTEMMELMVKALEEKGYTHIAPEGENGFHSFGGEVDGIKLDQVTISTTADGIAVTPMSDEGVVQTVAAIKALINKNPDFEPTLTGQADMQQMKCLNEFMNQDMMPDNVNANDYEKLFKNEDGTDKSVSMTDATGKKTEMSLDQFKQKIEKAKESKAERQQENQQSLGS